MCDRLIIAVARNSAKTPLFSIEERMEILHTCCASGCDGVEIATFNGLLVDFCKARGVSFIVRGLRAIVDFDYEYAIALLNRQLAPDIDTVFLMAKGEYSFISSNIVREVASYGGDVTPFVPQFVHQKLRGKLSS